MDMEGNYFVFCLRSTSVLGDSTGRSGTEGIRNRFSRTFSLYDDPDTRSQVSKTQTYSYVLHSRTENMFKIIRKYQPLQQEYFQFQVNTVTFSGQMFISPGLHSTHFVMPEIAPTIT